MESQLQSITKPAGNGEPVVRPMGAARRLQVGGVPIDQGAKLLRIGKELMK
jgi:hypothetical protein